MKTLVIIAHPNMDGSKVNKAWKNHLENSDNITINEIYKSYPDGKIDVKREQELVKAHDRIVFQFPFHWYNAPSLLKQWMDSVFAFGFSHGPNGNSLKGKEFRLVISAGGQEQSYQAGGAQHFTISELTKTYEAMAKFTGMNCRPAFVLYATHLLSEEDINKSADKLKSILN